MDKRIFIIGTIIQLIGLTIQFYYDFTNSTLENKLIGFTVFIIGTMVNYLYLVLENAELRNKLGENI